jgi:hypothetical protein
MSIRRRTPRFWTTRGRVTRELEARLRLKFPDFTPGEGEGAIAFVRCLVDLVDTAPTLGFPPTPPPPRAIRRAVRRRKLRDLKRRFPTAWRERRREDGRLAQWGRRLARRQRPGRPTEQPVWATVWLLRYVFEAVFGWKRSWGLIAGLLNAAQGTGRWTPAKLRAGWHHHARRYDADAEEYLTDYVAFVTDHELEAQEQGQALTWDSWTGGSPDPFRFFLLRLLKAGLGAQDESEPQRAPDGQYRDGLVTGLSDGEQ